MVGSGSDSFGRVRTCEAGGEREPQRYRQFPTDSLLTVADSGSHFTLLPTDFPTPLASTATGHKTSFEGVSFDSDNGFGLFLIVQDLHNLAQSLV